MQQVSTSSLLSLHGVTIGFNTAGALSTLTMGGVSYADAGHVVGEYEYQTYNATTLAKYPTCCWWDNSRQKYTNAQVGDPQRRYGLRWLPWWVLVWWWWWCRGGGDW